MDLLEILRVDYPGVSEASARALQDVAVPVTVKKMDYLVEQGKRSNHIYFITGGLFRGTALYNGQEDTLLFGIAGDPFASVHSLVNGEPAQFSMQALEDSSALAVTFSDFRRLIDERPDLMRWWSTVLLLQVYCLERRYVWIGTCDATQRYKTMLKIRSSIINRIPLKYVAQYLNVTPETLSRIRAKIAKE
ncbi:MAG: Crp/Fnr family transcriptional regulator [Muribaculaceae bacterium]